MGYGEQLKPYLLARCIVESMMSPPILYAVPAVNTHSPHSEVYLLSHALLIERNPFAESKLPGIFLLQDQF